MKASTWVAVVVVLAVVAGAWYWFMPKQALAPAVQDTNTDTSAGTMPAQNDASPNDANMPDNGMVGGDGAVGTIIGSNLALGTDGNATLGTYLIGYTGMTLYTYSKDTGSVSTCYDTCATNWPPYIVGAEDNVKQVKSGVSASKVGTTVRTGGSIQMTYDGKPLYFYAKDRPNTSDATGQGVGGVWYVVKP
jgi:predicted lipoprotein with Yx(FWY)xxD motif